MYVKRFTGRTISEALSLARKELGEETLLLGVRRRPGEGAEVTVAVERPSPSDRTISRVPPAPPRSGADLHPSRLSTPPWGGTGSSGLALESAGASGSSSSLPAPLRAAPSLDSRSRGAVSLEEMFAAARIEIERSSREDGAPSVRSPFLTPSLPHFATQDSGIPSAAMGRGYEEPAREIGLAASVTSLDRADDSVDAGPISAATVSQSTRIIQESLPLTPRSDPSNTPMKLEDDRDVPTGESPATPATPDAASSWSEPHDAATAPVLESMAGRTIVVEPEAGTEAVQEGAAITGASARPADDAAASEREDVLAASDEGVLSDLTRTENELTEERARADAISIERPIAETEPPSESSPKRELPSGAPAFALSARARSRSGPRSERQSTRKKAKSAAPSTSPESPSFPDTARPMRPRSLEASVGAANVEPHVASGDGALGNPRDGGGRHARDTKGSEPGRSSSHEGESIVGAKREPGNHGETSPENSVSRGPTAGGVHLTNGTPSGLRPQASAFEPGTVDTRATFTVDRERSANEDSDLVPTETDIRAGFDLITRRIQKLVDEIRPRSSSGVDSHLALPALEEIAAKLAATGLEAGLCEAASRSTRALGAEGTVVARSSFLGSVRGSLASMLAPVPVPATSKGPRIVALVGPAGTGKTTTAVKLAVRDAVSRKSRVVLVGADHRRIGALEPLRECAALIDASLEVVTNAYELESVLARRSDADLIIIDTPGVPPADSRRLFELERLLEAAPSVEAFLVLSATTRARDLELAIRRFGALSSLQLVFTKMDETHAHGELLGEAAACGRPVTWFGTGPSIPDDLEIATPERFAEIVVGAAWPA